MDTIPTLGPGSRVRHPAYGDGAVIRLNRSSYEVCFMHHGIKPVSREYDKWDIIEALEANEQVSFSAAEKSLIKILRQFSDVTEEVELKGLWNDGTMILQPADTDLKPKEIPIQVFFHKIVMVRDRLRVMEQRINASKSLTDEEKVNLQQYITRIYGSLTTFNVLFKYAKDHFKGESGSSS